MIKRFLVALLCALMPLALFAQEFSGLARASADGSAITSNEVTLSLSQGVPFRIFTLADPARMIVDFAEVDFSDLDAQSFVQDATAVTDVRFGRYQPRWSRMVLDLSGPFVPTDVDMRVDTATNTAELSFGLNKVDEVAFRTQSGTPPGWDAIPVVTPVAPKQDASSFIVVLDPGHGGVDPGAERGGLVEKELALTFARQVRDNLRRAGVEVVLTRNEDIFVSLEARTATAHQVGGAVFVSLHADALSQGGAQGATVYTLSDEASDAASARLAERHNRADILAGVDLSGADDEVTAVLLDLARQETEPRSDTLAQTIIAGMNAAGGPMNRKPWRKAGFSVLKSADIPSVLVEMGFLSSKRDQKNLGDPKWQARMAKGVADAILVWRDEDAALRQLLRQ